MSTCSQCGQSVPEPKLPTTPGVTGTAVVRGVPGVRVMRVEHAPMYYKDRWVSVPRVHDQRWHRDEHIANFVPDPDTTTRCEASGMTRYVCQARDICDCFAPRVVPDDRVDGSAGGVQTAVEPPCECGHGRDEHSWSSGRWDCWTCAAYRPAAAPEPACICTRDTSGHIVSLDPTCPARDADPTPAPATDLCECGHARIFHHVGTSTRCARCPCLTYRPAPQPEPTGLVERVAEAVRVTDSAAGLIHFATAKWMTEQTGRPSAWNAADLIRREVEGSGTP